MTQPSLLNLPLNLDGVTYEPARDGARLSRQLELVEAIMKDGQWHTMADIYGKFLGRGMGASEAGISARLRDLRKPKFGGHTIEREYVADGVWRYRMVG